MNMLVKDLPVSVGSVKIKGNTRTKTSFIETELGESLESRTIKDLYSNLDIAVSRLKSTGVFDYVDIELEILESNAANYKTDLVVNLKEKGIPFLKMDTFVKKADIISGECVMQTAIRNPIGYGESLKASVGTSTTGSNELQLHFHTPLIPTLKNSIDIILKASEENNSYYTSYTQDIKSLELFSFSRDRRHRPRFCPLVIMTQLPYTEASSALTSYRLVFEQFSYEFAFRDEVPLNHATAMAVKDASAAVTTLAQATTKSSLKYSYCMHDDSRPSVGLQTKMQGLFNGSNVNGSVEIALPPGTISFLKTELQGHKHMVMGPPSFGQQGLTLSLGATLGVLLPFFGDRSSVLSDRFFAGGPTSVRGFVPYGIGPRGLAVTGGSNLGDALGGDVKTGLLAMLSVPVPLPSLATRGIRALMFFNTGSLTESLRGWSVWKELSHTRASVGVGLTLPIASGARADITYAVPLRKASHDQAVGFQLGFSFESSFSGKV